MLLKKHLVRFFYVICFIIVIWFLWIKYVREPVVIEHIFDNSCTIQIRTSNIIGTIGYPLHFVVYPKEGRTLHSGTFYGYSDYETLREAKDENY